MIKKTFQDPAELDALKADLDSEGLIATCEHLDVDGSGFILHLDAEGSQAAIQSAVREELQATDVGLARGLEDLIDLLEEDGMTIRARLPQELQDKLDRRATLRGSLL